jgi:hypothetical protein
MKIIASIGQDIFFLVEKTDRVKKHDRIFDWKIG